MFEEYSKENEIQLIESIKKMKGNEKVFPNYIKNITFPFYKNIEENTRIDFDFPLTILVGSNGTNKSSVLRAIQATIDGNSLEDYWFSTVVDPIEETGISGVRHCFFYEYIDSNDNYIHKQVLKQRAPREDKPDYWETARPTKKYGMRPMPDELKGKRYSAVSRKDIFLDFRSELSAFDKYYYLGVEDKDLKERKKYLRRKSISLKKVMENSMTIKSGGKNKKSQNELPEILSDEELKVISFVLGKKYLSGLIIEHKLFKVWGYSIFLSEGSNNYSEAMAGSGEVAVVRIIHELLSAPKGALVLLDEPECSLHPGAQYKLKYFILKEIKEKKLQVIISTHSVNFMNNLPDTAVKKFEWDDNLKKVVVQNNVKKYEAFKVLGQESKNMTLNIQVEDLLAQKIVENILRRINPIFLECCNIFYLSGGATTIKTRNIVHYVMNGATNENFIIFDGDQNENFEFKELEDFTDREKTIEKFDEYIMKFAKGPISFPVDGSGGLGNKKQKLDYQQKYYKFFKENVFYLPSLIPEDIIWDEEFVKMFVLDKDKQNEIINKTKTKDKIKSLALEISGTTESIPVIEDMLLKLWISKESNEKNQIINILNTIIEKSKI